MKQWNLHLQPPDPSHTPTPRTAGVASHSRSAQPPGSPPRSLRQALRATTRRLGNQPAVTHFRVTTRSTAGWRAVADRRHAPTPTRPDRLSARQHHARASIRGCCIRESWKSGYKLTRCQRFPATSPRRGQSVSAASRSPTHTTPTPPGRLSPALRGKVSAPRGGLLSASASVTARRLAAGALVSVGTLPASAADHAHPERSKVQISAVQYDSPGRDDRSNRSLNREWVEVANTARRAVNLDGWTLEDEDGPHLHLRPLPPGRPFHDPHPHRLRPRHRQRSVPGPPQLRLGQPLRHRHPPQRPRPLHRR